MFFNNSFASEENDHNNLMIEDKALNDSHADNGNLDILLSTLTIFQTTKMLLTLEMKQSKSPLTKL